MFEDATDTEIIQMHGLLLKEMRRRNIIRTKNVTGDLGERLVLDYYNRTPSLPNLQLAPPSTANIDAISTNGERYSIKSISGSSTGVFRGLPANDSFDEPQQTFEYVIIVQFEDFHEPQRIFELTWDQFLSFKRWHSREKAWNLTITREVLRAARIIYPLANT